LESKIAVPVEVNPNRGASVCKAEYYLSSDAVFNFRYEAKFALVRVVAAHLWRLSDRRRSVRLSEVRNR
jgi:hypothetical protein